MKGHSILIKGAILFLGSSLLGLAHAQSDFGGAMEQLQIRPFMGFSEGSNFQAGSAVNQSTGEVKKVTLGPNSGFSIGALARYKVDQKIFFEGGASYHSSSETPAVKDASASFTHTELSATVLTTYQLNESSGLYFGAGADYHIGPKMSVSGFGDVKANYKNAIGYHVTFGWEQLGPKHGGFPIAVGLRVNKVTYAAEKLWFGAAEAYDITAPDGTSLRNLNGDSVGLELLMIISI